MMFAKFELVAIVTLALTTSAQAREASLMLFYQATTTSTTSAAPATGDVDRALRTHMQSMTPSVPQGPFMRYELPRLLQKRPDTSSIVTSILGPEMVVPKMQTPCISKAYSPTWWLPPEVEVRRAAHFDTMASAACEFGIPTKLLDAVVAQESGYKSWAISSAGAIGMMQIMPGTARTLGLVLPFDPIANLRAGARYLRLQLDRFGRIDLALAAYNAGPERRSLQRGFVPAIPETLNYVRTITTNWARLSTLDEIGGTGVDRAHMALSAIRASGYRDIEFVRYDGLNAAKPM